MLDADADLALISIEEDLHHALRGTAQREWVFRSGGLRADAKEADQGVDAVGQQPLGEEQTVGASQLAR